MKNKHYIIQLKVEKEKKSGEDINIKSPREGVQKKKMTSQNKET